VALEDLGLIGNCQISALVDRRGAIVWSCMPRFDSEPVFGALLDDADGGSFAIGPADGSHATVDAILADLDHQGWLKRYRTDDGFGQPAVAFMLCTFWLVEALAVLGRFEEARSILDLVRQVRTPLGLLSEDVDPSDGKMWGNFPQAYSHVGLIHAAFAAAPRWSDFC